MNRKKSSNIIILIIICIFLFVGISFICHVVNSNNGGDEKTQGVVTNESVEIITNDSIEMDAIKKELGDAYYESPYVLYTTEAGVKPVINSSKPDIYIETGMSLNQLYYNGLQLVSASFENNVWSFIATEGDDTYTLIFDDRINDMLKNCTQQDVNKLIKSITIYDMLGNCCVKEFEKN